MNTGNLITSTIKVNKIAFDSIDNEVIKHTIQKNLAEAIVLEMINRDLLKIVEITSDSDILNNVLTFSTSIRVEPNGRRNPLLDI